MYWVASLGSVRRKRATGHVIGWSPLTRAGHRAVLLVSPHRRTIRPSRRQSMRTRWSLASFGVATRSNSVGAVTQVALAGTGMVLLMPGCVPAHTVRLGARQRWSARLRSPTTSCSLCRSATRPCNVRRRQRHGRRVLPIPHRGLARVRAHDGPGVIRLASARAPREDSDILDVAAGPDWPAVSPDGQLCGAVPDRYGLGPRGPTPGSSAIRANAAERWPRGFRSLLRHGNVVGQLALLLPEQGRRLDCPSRSGRGIPAARRDAARGRGWADRVALGVVAGTGQCIIQRVHSV